MTTTSTGIAGTGDISAYLNTVGAVGGYAITDTCDNVASNIDSLKTNLAYISSIRLSDSKPLSISAIQLTSNISVLNKISNTEYTLIVSGVSAENIAILLAYSNEKMLITSLLISDSSANIAISLDALQANHSKISSITLTNTTVPLAITATQLTSDASALAKIVGLYSLAVSAVPVSAITTTLANTKVASISITDSSTTIAASLNNLQTNNSKISSITQIGTVAPLAITATQFSNNALVIAKISGLYSLAVSAVKVAAMKTVIDNLAVTSVAISDSSTNIAASLNELQTNNNKISSITQIGFATPLAITFTQLTDDALVLAKIVGLYSLAVSQVPVADISTTLGNSKVTLIAISDTSENIATRLNVLQTNVSKISSITQIGIAAPLAITATQVTSFALALAKIKGEYSLEIPTIPVEILTSVLANKYVNPVSISDSSANIAASLNTLNTNILRISSITQTGTAAALAITATQLNANAAVLAKIGLGGAYTLAVSQVSVATMPLVLQNSHVTSFSISDSSVNIANNLDLLQANRSKIVSIIQTGTVLPLVITETQFFNDDEALSLMALYSLIVSEVSVANMSKALADSHVTSITISDSSANISIKLDDLQANISKITRITLTDTASPLVISATQLSSDALALSKISGIYSLTIPAIPVELMAKALANKYITPFAINDSSDNISTYLDILQANISKISSITLTGTAAPLAITNAQLTKNALALAKISGVYSLEVSLVLVSEMATVLARALPLDIKLYISDSSANIAGNLDVLQSNLDNILGIALTGIIVPLVITNTQLSSAASVLAKISSRYFLAVSVVPVIAMNTLLTNSQVTSVSISDSSANIVTYLDSLQTNINKISTIIQTGTVAPLAITVTQLSSDALALAKIVGFYSLAVSAVPVSAITTTLSNTKVASFSISDSSANIATNLDELKYYLSKISSITQTGTVAPLAITATQLTSGASVLAKISDDYQLTISGVSVAAMPTVLANSHVISFSISDSSANIATHLDALQANISKISSIMQTGIVAPLGITATQFTNDASAIAKISGVYFLVVSSTPVAVMATAFDNSHVTSFSISDSSANIATHLDALQASLSKISSITQTGTAAPLAISATQLRSDALALAKISGLYSLAVSGIPIAEMNSVLANSHVNSISIIDTEANFTANLNALNAKVTSISSIILIDSHVLAITTVQQTTMATLLSKIIGGYTLAANVISTADLQALGSSVNAALVVISDSSFNIATNLDALQTNINKISSITLTGTNVPLAITVTQLISNASALAKISGLYSLSVSAVPVAVMSMVLANSHVKSLSIIDTQENFTANLSALIANVSYISSVTLTDSHVLAITAAQKAAATTLLDKIVGDYTLEANVFSTADLGAIAKSVEPVLVVISDSSANIAMNLDALQANISKISSIRQTGTVVPLAITATQLINDASALAKISGEYYLTFTSVSIDAMATTLANTKVASISISDSSANIATHLDALQANLSKISSITQIGTAAPLAITATQLNSDAMALAKISGSYSLTVSGIPIAAMSSVLANSHVNSFSIIDTQANFTANLSVLNAKVSSISSVILTDSHVLAITAAQKAAAITLLSKIEGGYTLEANVISTADLQALASSVSPVLVVISDNSANIATHLDALQANISKISSIMLTDTIVPLAITGTQLTRDASALAKISGPYSLAVSEVPAGAMSIVLANSHINSLSIKDTQANFIENLSVLNANVSFISSITLTDSKKLLITAAQEATAKVLLSKIVGSYTLGAHVISTADLQTLATFVGSELAVISDSSANIATNLDALQAYVSKISSISQSGTVEPLAITAAQLKSDASALAKISGLYSLVVSAVPVAAMSQVLATSHVSSISITDTGAHFTENLNTLSTNVNSISTITLTDTHVLTITAQQQTAAAMLLSKIVGGYALGINAVPNQTITGTADINTVNLSEPFLNFTVSVSGYSATLVDKAISTYGTLILNSIERVQFNDGSALALDFQPGQNGYLTAMMIGTAFGFRLVPTYFVPGVSLFDAGKKNLQIVELIVENNIIEKQIRSNSNKDWVDFVYENVMGVAPDAVSEDLFVSYLNNGTYTKTTLLALAFDAAVGGIGSVADQINLVGLQSHGLKYSYGVS
jgi:hypothetical protein